MLFTQFYNLLTVILLGIFSIVYLKLAIKYQIIDKPNERSSHIKSTVRGGGILFTIAIVLFFVFNDFQYSYFLIGTLLIAVVSFLDDIYTLSAKIRFPFQCIAVLLVLYQIGVPIEALSLLYLLFGIGTLNLFNFMDGINGITGLYAISVLVSFYCINRNEAIINPDLIIYSLFSLIIFGFYNFRKKAIFFAGDIGSITIGILIFFITLHFALTLKSPLIIVSIIVYGADTGLTFLYRKFYTNESVFEPHRHHIYQKLVDIKKSSHLKVSLMYSMLQLLVNIVVYKTYQLDIMIQCIILGSFASVFIFAYISLFKNLKKTP